MVGGERFISLICTVEYLEIWQMNCLFYPCLGVLGIKKSTESFITIVPMCPHKGQQLRTKELNNLGYIMLVNQTPPCARGQDKTEYIHLLYG